MNRSIVETLAWIIFGILALAAAVNAIITLRALYIWGRFITQT
jgi:uncharacterized membrane protein